MPADHDVVGECQNNNTSLSQHDRDTDFQYFSYLIHIHILTPNSIPEKAGGKFRHFISQRQILTAGDDFSPACGGHGGDLLWRSSLRLAPAHPIYGVMGDHGSPS